MKYLLLILMLTIALAVPAHADVIVSPFSSSGPASLVGPIVLLILVIVATVLLLKAGKKK